MENGITPLNQMGLVIALPELTSVPPVLPRYTGRVQGHTCNDSFGRLIC
jgi:hypothetical protein